MKAAKKSIKIILFLFVILLIFYLSLYIIAKRKPKLPIKSANQYLLYDINGNLLETSNNEWIKLDDISKYLIDATISIEDKNFYHHIGFDYLRIFKSLYINFKNKDNLQGASTITQQLAKNLYLSFDKKWKRKIKEAWLTIELESQYSKNEILEAY